MSLREHNFHSLSKNTFGQSSIDFLKGNASAVLLKSEAVKYFEIPKLISRLWNDLKECRYLDDGILTISNLDEIFKYHSELFSGILKIHTSNDLVKVIDENSDGMLNEDEQILIFSIIKEKMIRLSNSLLSNRLYDYYKKLMEKIEEVERIIAYNQNDARKFIQENEINNYKENGMKKMEDFYIKFNNVFTNLMKEKEARFKALDRNHEFEKQNFLSKKDNIKVPKNVQGENLLVHIKKQEVLSSLAGRIEEAKGHLKDSYIFSKALEEKEERVKLSLVNKKYMEMVKKQTKEVEMLKMKFENKENKLKIEMLNEFDLISKKTNLHEHEINRIHSMMRKFGLEKGLKIGPLIRLKKTLKRQNNVIHNFEKEIPKSAASHKTLKDKSLTKDMRGKSASLQKKKTFHASQIALTFSQNTEQIKNIYHLRDIANSQGVQKFYIRNIPSDNMPVNSEKVVLDQEGKGMKKVSSILSKTKESEAKEIIPLTMYYDKNLNFIPFLKKPKESKNPREMRRIQSAIHTKMKEKYT